MKFYGQFEVPVDRFIFERYFPDPDIKGIFVECGAFDGQMECSCRFFEETMDWRGFNLEPVPWIFEKLNANRPSSRNLNVGLSDASGTLPFQSVIHPAFGRDTTIGSIRHDEALKDLLVAQGCTFEEIAIEVITWSQFIQKEGVKHIDLMVLDVEGHELSVLAGMRGSRVLPHVMCVEFGHIGIEKLRLEMSALGYDYDIHSYANAFFVRKDMLPLFAMRQASAATRAKNDNEVELALQRATLDAETRKTEELHALQAELGKQINSADELRDENQWRREREMELVELLTAMSNSKGWRALQVAKDVWHWRRQRTAVKSLKASERQVPVPSVTEEGGVVISQFADADTLARPSEPKAASLIGSEEQSLSDRVGKLERQLELVEKHHLRGFWHTLDRIDDLSLASRQLKCLICENEDERNGFEILTSQCIFGGGRLERYRCPTCDCVTAHPVGNLA